MNKITLFFSSVFGVGYIKDAPGTFGSIIGILLWAFFAPANYYAQIPVVVCMFFVSVVISHLAEDIYQSKDDQRIVIDEVAGVWVAAAFLPQTVAYLVAAFVLFRIFDITKPLFIKKAQIFRGGFGITVDDIFAGVFANLILQAIRVISQNA
ncbi:phosphatidylglycerophosphatase A [Endomicrobium proavitum]|uniref:Phosphatidylglycerophosphatase A n=1 Tax=Endomicrobium proavitum TaxID=1408281 RepID=A0A0G3WJD0_9BACT|nr:phosphatidylglycerophosphatase A [Endomicrobium proavitum]AKL97952.1 Phosphatidylglycerophosphatase A [Endomicrobium proavitum]